MDFELVLVDVNADVVRAFREVFADRPEVRVVHGSMLDQRVSAWVSPTNSEVQMNGGLDAAIRGRLGGKIQARVRAAVGREFDGSLPLGYAVCVPTGHDAPSLLISTPTMITCAEHVGGTMNVVLACAAALHAADVQNRAFPGSVRSLAMPGLGAGTGGVEPRVCAELMWNACSLFDDAHFASFAEVRTSLEAIVGPLDDQSALARESHARRARLWSYASN